MDAEVSKRIRALAIDRGQWTAPVSRIIRSTEIGEAERIPYGPALELTESFEHRWLEEERVIDGKKQGLLMSSCDHCIALLSRLGHRLFDKNMTAHVKRLKRQLAMRGGRRKDVNDVRLCLSHFP
jgi:hypothetical protein